MAEPVQGTVTVQRRDTAGVIAGVVFAVVGLVYLIGGDDAFNDHWNLVCGHPRAPRRDRSCRLRRSQALAATGRRGGGSGRVRLSPRPIWQYRDMTYHLAQVNHGRLVASLDDPQLAGFVSALEPVNAAADSAPGFVWRLQGDGGSATDIEAFGWDIGDSVGVIVNMSVWTDMEHLTAFVYSDAHRAVLGSGASTSSPWSSPPSPAGGCPRAISRPPTRPRNGCCTCAPTGPRRTPSPSASTSRRRSRRLSRRRHDHQTHVLGPYRSPCR